jgi:hypothetical protein
MGYGLPDIGPDIDTKNISEYEFWRIMFGLPVIPVILQTTLFISCFHFETPKFINQRKSDKKEVKEKDLKTISVKEF